MQKFLTIISAINDESRVLILYHLLKYQELCVCDLQKLLNMGQSVGGKIKCNHRKIK